MDEAGNTAGQQTRKSDEPEGAGREAPLLVVGLGASAGGIEPLEEFFSHMPPDSGMAFVVVMHLAPDHNSIVQELLAMRTKMPVTQVLRDTPVKTDHVYVIPPNRTLTIEQSVLRVAPPAGRRSSWASIDHFFRSLARDQGDKAVCVLLSGAGTDGTLGLRAIKEHGGLAIAQSAESALHDSIPLSAISTGLVDHVLDVKEIPDRLTEHARFLRSLEGRPAPEDLAKKKAGQLAEICSILRRRKGHDCSQYKETTLIRRIHRRMQVVQTASLDDYVKLLRENSGEQDRLFSDLLIGVTHFFRDPEAFQALAEYAIPKIAAGKTQHDEVRVWVIGCSTGEEIYSIGILICEFLSGLPPESRPRAKIFGTDIDEEALEIARTARYSSSIEEHVSRERLERFFIKHDGFYQIKRGIREMCIFSLHSIVRDPPFSRLNLISCRNLLIYFTSEIQKQIVPLLHYALAPRGFIFLGPSESIAAPGDFFKTIDKKHRIFERGAGASPPPAALPIGAVNAPFRPLVSSPRRIEDRNLANIVERNILRNYSPACVVITERGDAVYFSGRTGAYLEPPEGEPNLDVLGMARDDLRAALRAAIHRAVETRSEAVKENIPVRTNGGFHLINLTVRPLLDSGDDSGLYLVVFQELPRERSKDSAAETPASAIDDAIAHLERELRSTKENLQTTIEELETSNEELRSANEELQSANEELQSSKEEYQSLNEELETVNSELSAKVEELDRANSDLQNLLESTQIAAIFLDNELRIRGFTPATGRIYRLLRSDVGRLITDFGQRFTEGDLAEDSRQVLRSLTPVERLIRHAETSEWFKMRVLPYRTTDAIVRGIVITFIDVTEENQSEEALRRMNEDLKQFAYAASHDLQEPLRMVVSFSQLLDVEYGEKLDENAKTYIRTCVDGALRIERLLRAMRQYWKVVEQPEDIESSNSGDALQEAIGNLTLAIESSGAVITHDGLPEVSCPKSWLMQLFQNLIGNAIKYRSEAPPLIHVSCEKSGREWIFSVKDNGIGIESRHLTRIFGIFRRLHGNQYPGEGIGLALCTKIVERCGGRIWAESEPGNGSTFKFTVPIVSRSPASGQ